MSLTPQYFLDTNCFLKDNSINEISKYKQFHISSLTLQELENIKTSSKKDESVKYLARKAVRFLCTNQNKFNTIIYTKRHDLIVDEFKIPNTADNLIVACAYDLSKQIDNLIFVTGDLICGIVAEEIFDLNVKKQLVNFDENLNYKGYKEIYVDESNEKDIEFLEKIYEKSTGNPCSLLTNQYLIIKDKESHKRIDILKWNGFKLLKLKRLPKKIVTPKNDLQACAIDLLMDNDVPIKVLFGVAGSGKTLLATKIGMYLLNKKDYYNKIMIVRNPTGTGEEIGFIKGDKYDKIREFYNPIFQHLEFGEVEAEKLMQEGRLEAQIPFYMKGLDIQNTFVIFDEAEDADQNIIKLIGSRMAKNTSMIFSGDVGQSENKFKHNNGLIELINKAKGNSLFGCIKFEEDLRSQASKVFADLM